MKDNVLIAALISVIGAGLQSQGVSAVVKQSQQPTQQGVPTGAAIFLTKIGDNRYGFPKRVDVFDAQTSTMTHTETEKIETTFQVNALAPTNPADITALTTADYLKLVGRILQFEPTISALRASGIGIYRVQKQAQIYIVDDKGQNEAAPSFDFIVTHDDTISADIGSVNTVTINIFVT